MRKLLKKIANINKTNSVDVDKFLQKRTVKLNVGCGTDYKKGWVNIDNNSDNNINDSKLDLNWDLRNPLPFPDNSVNFIFNEHFIEHLTVDEGKAAVRDFIRVLKPGGVLRMATPDLETVVDKYISIPLDEDPTIANFNLGFIKTRAERINIVFRWWGHKWLYDWEELERRMMELGLKKNQLKRCKLNVSKYKQLNNLETREESKLIIEVTK